MSLQILAATISVALLVYVLELVRRQKLTFKYAFAWLLVSVLAIGVSIFDGIVFAVAAWLGFELPSNFIFFALFCIFILLSLLLTVFLCQQNSRNDAMAQKIGILEMEIDRLKKSTDTKHT